MSHRCVSCSGSGTVLCLNAKAMIVCPYCKGTKVETRPEVLARLARMQERPPDEVGGIE